jgi:hypothetical protein
MLAKLFRRFWRKVSPVKYAGERIKVGKASYVLPPMPLGGVYLLEQIKDGVFSTNESMQAFMQVLHISLTRNYPEFDSALLGQELGLPDFAAIYATFVRVNGLEAKDQGKVTAASP